MTNDESPHQETTSSASSRSKDDEPELDEWWSWGNFARLFIFPLIIVLVAVLIYGLFQFMLRDRRTVQDYIQGIESGARSQRWRMAYSLAQEVRQHGRDREFTARTARELIRLYRTAEDPRIRQYLAHVLATLPLESSIAALEEGLTDPNPGVRVNSALALGRLREQVQSSRLQRRFHASVPKLIDLLDDSSSEVRRMASFVLGSLGDTEAVDALKTTLNDPAEDVKWNGAIALGRLGSSAGEEVLLTVLRDAARNRLGDLEPSVRQNLVVNAIRAVGKLGTSRARSVLERLADNDDDPEVRKAALRAVETLGPGSESTS